jgi:hypothetical protein
MGHRSEAAMLRLCVILLGFLPIPLFRVVLCLGSDEVGRSKFIDTQDMESVVCSRTIREILL